MSTPVDLGVSARGLESTQPVRALARAAVAAGGACHPRAHGLARPARSLGRVRLPVRLLESRASRDPGNEPLRVDSGPGGEQDHLRLSGALRGVVRAAFVDPARCRIGAVDAALHCAGADHAASAGCTRPGGLRDHTALAAGLRRLADRKRDHVPGLRPRLRLALARPPARLRIDHGRDDLPEAAALAADPVAAGDPPVASLCIGTDLWSGAQRCGMVAHRLRADHPLPERRVRRYDRRLAHGLGRPCIARTLWRELHRGSDS